MNSFTPIWTFLPTGDSPDCGSLARVCPRISRRCRYAAGDDHAGVQRKSETEERFLTEHESWEALNETWAVFVGWTYGISLKCNKDTAGGIVMFLTCRLKSIDGFNRLGAGADAEGGSLEGTTFLRIQTRDELTHEESIF